MFYVYLDKMKIYYLYLELQFSCLCRIQPWLRWP